VVSIEKLFEYNHLSGQKSHLHNEKVCDVVVTELRHEFGSFKCAEVATISQDDIVISWFHLMNDFTIPCVFGEEAILLRIFVYAIHF